MKKNQAPANKPEKNKKLTKHHKEEDSYQNEDSFDDVFRFDDRLIGKRTNTIFQPHSNSDGFYDFNVHPALDTSISLYKQSPSKSYYSVDIYSEAEEKKNQKMVQYLDQIADGATVSTFSDLSDLSDFDGSQSSPSNTPIKNLQKQEKNKVNKNTLNESVIYLKEDKQDIPTAWKKNQTIPEKNEFGQIVVDSQKSTLSRKNLRPQGQQINSMPQIVTLKGEKQIKIRNPEKIKQDIKLNKEKSEKMIKTKFQQRLQNKKPRISQPQSISVSALVIQNKLKQKQSQRIQRLNCKSQQYLTLDDEQFEAEAEEYQEIMKKAKKNSRKRNPTDFQNDQRQDELYKKTLFKKKIDIKKPKNQIYAPFRNFGEEERYPTRIRTRPLRYWFNQRKNYDEGTLVSVSLVDDIRGRETEAEINKVIRNRSRN